MITAKKLKSEFLAFNGRSGMSKDAIARANRTACVSDKVRAEREAVQKRINSITLWD